MSPGPRLGRLLPALLVGLLLLGAVPSAALDPNRRLTQYRFENWGVEEGLPSLSVSVVAQTPDGYLWVGTTEGLARFDGVRFKTYDRWNTPAFRLNEIRSLFVDSRGALWIGFAGSGVVVRERDEFVAVEPSDLTAVDFAEDADGVLLATDRGLFHRRNETSLRFEPVPAAATLSGEMIYHVDVDRRGRTWLNVLKRGVFWLEGGALHGPLSFGSPVGVGDEYSTSLLDAQGEPMFSRANGLFRLAGEEVRRFTPARAKAEDPQYAQFVDRSGVLWSTGILRAGSRRLFRGVEESFPVGHRIADGRFSPMYEDREGNLWFGSWTQGLARLSDGPLMSFSEEEGLSSDAARTLLEDASGAIWVGTTNGLNRIADGRIDAFRRPRTSTTRAISTGSMRSPKMAKVAYGSGPERGSRGFETASSRHRPATTRSSRSRSSRFCALRPAGSGSVPPRRARRPAVRCCVSRRGAGWSSPCGPTSSSACSPISGARSGRRPRTVCSKCAPTVQDGVKRRRSSRCTSSS